MDEENYNAEHQPFVLGDDVGCRFDDLTGNSIEQECYPVDVYEKLKNYAMDAAEVNRETMAAITKARNNPEAEVTIYRGVPKNVEKINPGDWVTPSKTYAEHHAKANLKNQEQGHVLELKVKACELFSDGNSLAEWGYWPKEVQIASAELERTIEEQQQKEARERQERQR